MKGEKRKGGVDRNQNHSEGEAEEHTYERWCETHVMGGFNFLPDIILRTFATLINRYREVQAHSIIGFNFRRLSITRVGTLPWTTIYIHFHIGRGSSFNYQRQK